MILGGLLTSTFCEFLIHPGLFWQFSGRDAARLAQSSETLDDLLADAGGQPADSSPEPTQH